MYYGSLDHAVRGVDANTIQTGLPVLMTSPVGINALVA